MIGALAHRMMRLKDDTSGLALLEFAFILPVFLTLCLTGAEMTNYITTKMRISQLALHLADNAARMGTGSQLTAKTISESDIDDLFTGAQLQSSELDLRTNGRVILTDLEQDPNNAGKYKIGWRRCYGLKTSYVRKYPDNPSTSALTNLPGIGPSGRQVTALSSNPTMFVEVFYTYVPLVGGSLAPTTTFTEIASMAVRDRRDLTQIYNTTYPLINC
ncbi:MAG: TadE family protein [Sphingomonas sp.]|jgi:Flp pilus assembly protein TadG|uniref:TadE/TadG family type IV pilus assembly protein n=1 Tax=Sphingomonas sp. TaxID=28214 RepID=UPI0035699EF2